MNAIALVDCNTFYVSCERILDETLRHSPVIVLSNNDGVVVSRSNEAKALGIEWDPFFKIKYLVYQHGVRYFSSNYRYYGEISGRVMSILKQFSPNMEHYSIDEAFLELSDISNLNECGREIRQRLLQWLEIPVSIGIAETKTLAKVANKLAKSSQKAQGVLNLYRSPWLNEALRRTPVDKVWGVGRQWSEKLRRYKVYTAYDLKNIDDHIIMKHFNVVMMRTVFELRGIPCLPLTQEPPLNKTLIRSQSFHKPVREYQSVRQALASYATEAAADMRCQKLACRELSVFVETNRHYKDEPQYNNSITLQLPAPTEYTAEIITYAVDALSEIYLPEYRYNKVGVQLGKLFPSSEMQQILFAKHDLNRAAALMEALDILNYRYGDGTVRYGSEGFDKSAFRMNQAFLSSNGKTLPSSDFQMAKGLVRMARTTGAML